MNMYTKVYTQLIKFTCKIKKHFSGTHAAIFLLVFTFSALPQLSAETREDSLHLASWNIRILSNSSRDNTELPYIAQILSKYDLTAIQEVRDSVILDRICSYLNVSTDTWKYIISAPVGRGVKERYAYFYNSDKVSPVGTAYLFNDPEDRLIREPFIAHFTSGNFDFTLVTIHILFGDSISERREEIRLLDTVLLNIDTANTFEDDIILLGDFNMPKDDISWRLPGYIGLVEPAVKTTITDTSSYDNIWLPEKATFMSEFISFSGTYNFDEDLFGNNDKKASQYCSDHRPVSALFATTHDDDSLGNFFASTGFLNAADSTEILDTPHMAQEAPSHSVIIASVIDSPTLEESVSLKNISNRMINISNWTLGDKNKPNAMTFPVNTLLAPQVTLVLSHNDLGFVINNSDEVIFLKDSFGDTVAIWESP